MAARIAVVVLALSMYAMAGWASMPARAAGSELAVSVEVISGDVSLALADGGKRPLRSGEALPQGAVVVTGAGAVAQLTLANGVSARMAGSTRLRLDLASREKIEGHLGEVTCLKFAVTLDAGRAVFSVDNTEGALLDFRVLSPAATALVRGTVLAVAVADDGETLVSVRRGGADVVAGGRTVFIPEAYQSSVAPGGAPSPPMVWSETEEELWAREVGGYTRGG